ncbi:hypothetical protein J5N97_023014 [Dioscorea zingiberensis]|uniref:H(+)-exporting diphosphatase n=1 Tax=Dioscorea zingiberensis TaxID=325984 RepID=A0A9D5CCN4_9LILI|nr:hypothetical protein J5N97_023014 [Dioscorea zingiberensis]
MPYPANCPISYFCSVYGSGASIVALIAQLAGGLPTLATNLGVDHVGKVEQGIPEDDCNSAVISDLVGDKWRNNLNEILMLVFPDAGSEDGIKEDFNEVQLGFSLLWTGSTALSIYILGLYLIALGTGGMKSYVSFFGAYQFETIGPNKRLKKGSFFNWFYFLIYIGAPTSSSWLVWVQDNCCSGLGFGFTTLIMGKAMGSFFCGTPLCRFRRPRGSPLLRACQVVVDSARKWNVPVPIDCSLLHKLQISTIEGSLNMEHSDDLNPLDEIATLSDSDVKTEDSTNPWRVCTVTLVEELKTLGMDMGTTREIAIPIARKFTGKKIGAPCGKPDDAKGQPALPKRNGQDALACMQRHARELEENRSRISAGHVAKTNVLKSPHQPHANVAHQQGIGTSKQPDPINNETHDKENEDQPFKEKDSDEHWGRDLESINKNSTNVNYPNEPRKDKNIDCDEETEDQLIKEIELEMESLWNVDLENEKEGVNTQKEMEGENSGKALIAREEQNAKADEPELEEEKEMENMDPVEELISCINSPPKRFSKKNQDN